MILNFEPFGAAIGEPDALPIPVEKQRTTIAQTLEELDRQGDWQGTVRLLWAALNLEIPDLLPPELREQYAYRLGTLLMDHDMNADAATVLEAEVQRAGSKTARMVALLVEVFGSDRLNIPEKVLQYQIAHKNGLKKGL